VLLGQSVTMECSSTGLPAVTFFRFGPDDQQPLSADALAKAEDETRDAANDRLRGMLKDSTRGFEFTDELDKLVSGAGDKSYIAVVHADGNGIGRRFKQLVDNTPTSRACLDGLRKLSQAVNEAGKQALRATVQALVTAISPPHREREELEDFYDGLPKYSSTVRYLPFRPIIFGGDDLTFVCDGRLGLPLASIYLKAWEQASAQLPEGGQAYAYAGVAVVKTHYPFVRAYKLGEDLCNQTKKAVKEARKPGSAMDWHFAMSGIFGDIAAIRAREYQTRHGPLTVRPIALAPDLLNPPWRTWKHLQYLVGVFGGELIDERYRFDPKGKPYANTNAVKGLCEALRAGPNEVRTFRLARALKPLPLLDASTIALQETGWSGASTPYFDPIEALDFFLPLEEWENLR